MQRGDDEDPRDEPDGPFGSPWRFAALPRISGLTLSPDGTRLITGVAGLSPDRTRWVTALWELDPDGAAAARRLTRGTQDAGNAVLTPDNAVLYTSKRPDPDRADAEDTPARPQLWRLPAGSGEARVVLSHPGGVQSVRVAPDSGTVLLGVQAGPDMTTGTAEGQRRSARRDAGVTGVLHEQYPVRFWDHDLEAARTRLALADLPAEEEWSAPAETPEHGPDQPEADPLRDVSAPTPLAQDLSDVALSRDGNCLAVAVRVPIAGAGFRYRIDLRGPDGRWRTLVEDPLADLENPVFSPDGSRLACVRRLLSTYAEPPDETLCVVDVATGALRDLTPDFDAWPAGPVWSPDGTAIFFCADQAGHHPVFRVEAGTGEITRLTATGAYTDLQAHPDGERLFAIRSAVDHAPGPVRLGTHDPDQVPDYLPHPGAELTLPGTLHDVETTTTDGTRVRSWLVLPADAGPDRPAPLALWIHGGPLMSWMSWSWRWNPWLLAARGYAVLLPDPALSAGYGQDFVRRGWGEWGGAPYADLMAATDAALERPDLDPGRTVAMGGSFGGYMANWIAGHTERFRCIVSHAGLWHLDQFAATTDSAMYWAREFGDPLGDPARYVRNSPHRHAENIRTPMLVIHGDKDYRVPIGEATHLWYDLQRLAVPSRFLYFPDENHWVLTPGNVAVWYETVLAFAAEHVLGRPWRRPALL